METSGTFVSWLSEAAAGAVASLSDPRYWTVILAIVFLVILYSVVSSVNRINKRLASASSELSALRATLRKIELSLREFSEKRTPEDGEGKDVRDLLFRVDDDQQQ